MHAIARIAIFRDERLVVAHPELAVQSRKNKQAWRENGKLVWTDPSQPKVQDYNIALAKYVAQLGADEIQFDYVRFPAEGDQKDAQFVYQGQQPEAAQVAEASANTAVETAHVATAASAVPPKRSKAEPPRHPKPPTPNPPQPRRSKRMQPTPPRMRTSPIRTPQAKPATPLAARSAPTSSPHS